MAGNVTGKHEKQRGINTSFKVKLPEPSEQKTIELIKELRKFTKQF